MRIDPIRPQNSGPTIPAECWLRAMGYEPLAAVWNPERGAALLTREGIRALAVWREDGRPWVQEVASLERLVELVERVLPDDDVSVVEGMPDITFRTMRAIPRQYLRETN